MKVEIDLQQILEDEYGPAESLAQSIHRQVVERIIEIIDKGIKGRIEESVNAELSRVVREVVVPRMDSIVENLMNEEFTPVDRYGSKGKPTTFRSELINTITSECIVRRDNYHGKAENAFTKAVDSCVADLTKTLEANFRKEVDADFSKKAVQMAKETFAKCLGIK